MRILTLSICFSTRKRKRNYRSWLKYAKSDRSSEERQIQGHQSDALKRWERDDLDLKLCIVELAEGRGRKGGEEACKRAHSTFAAAVDVKREKRDEDKHRSSIRKTWRRKENAGM